MRVAIFDLDGCISDDRHRHYLLPHNMERGAVDEDYEAYHALLHLDKPINTDVLRAHLTLGHTIVIITARPEKFRSQTMRWLWLEFGEVADDFILMMRPDGDTRHSPELKLTLFQFFTQFCWSDVEAAYDDRADVLQAYKDNGCPRCVQLTAPAPAQPVTTDKLLHAMAETFAERNALYRDNYKLVGPVIKALFPEGVPPDLVTSDHWHLFELVIVKLARFARSGLTHPDSIHDVGVYSAMIQAEVLK